MSTFKLHILKDMDGVETCWEEAMKKGFQEKLPGVVYKGPEERQYWEISENYPVEYQKEIQDIYFAPGFFFNLKPKPGAIEATIWMLEKGFQINYCTSPLYCTDPKIVNRCIDEKREYLYETYKHFISPKRFFEPTCSIQFIPVYDKTVINAHYLIDNKPDITGVMKPTWKQLLFDEGYLYGKNFFGQKINWDEESPYFYKEVLTELHRRCTRG